MMTCFYIFQSRSLKIKAAQLNVLYDDIQLYIKTFRTILELNTKFDVKMHKKIEMIVEFISIPSLSQRLPNNVRNSSRVFC